MAASAMNCGTAALNLGCQWSKSARVGAVILECFQGSLGCGAIRGIKSGQIVANCVSLFSSGNTNGSVFGSNNLICELLWLGLFTPQPSLDDLGFGAAM